MKFFSNLLLQEVLVNKKNNHLDNYDEWMKYEPELIEQDEEETFYSWNLPLTSNIRKKLGVTYKFKDLIFTKTFYKKIVKNFTDNSFLFNLLNDQASKHLLIKILAYRILGYKKVKLPRNTKKYWDDIAKMKTLDIGQGGITIPFLNLKLPLLDLSSIDYQIKLNITYEAAAYVFMQHQYEYVGQNFILKAEKGDVVLDCGACCGDTAIYFSHEVGNDGKVYAFEFLPDNLKVLDCNLIRNPALAKNIQLIKHPVWDVSNKILHFVEQGPGTNVTEIKNQINGHECVSISIDDFVERFNVKRVDFIKMDIEGAELNALRGAEKTIKKFKPKLAISAYHKPDDFVTLPRYIESLNLDYEFYLDHHTIHKWETVLYAISAEKKSKR